MPIKHYRGVFIILLFFPLFTWAQTTITTVIGAGTTGPGFSGDGGPARFAQLRSPEGLAIDEAGHLFVSDSFNNRVRKISSDGVIRAVAGNGTQGFSGDGGPATAAQLFTPFGVTIDTSGIADSGNDRVRKISMSQSSSLSTASASQKPKVWDVTNEIATRTGIEIKKHAKLKLTITGNEIVFDGPKRAGFVVRARDVIEATYDNVAVSRVSLWDLASAPPFPLFDKGPYWMVGPLIDTAFIGSTWAIAQAFKAKDHFINLLWSKDGMVGEIVFEAAKNDYAPILAQIQQATGKAWKNLPEQREQLLRDIEKHKQDAFSILLEKDAVLDSVRLKAGPYKVLFLERGDNAGGLYFFSGKEVAPKNVNAVVPVSAAFVTSSIFPPEIVFDDTGSRIVELRTTAARYRLQPLSNEVTTP